MKTSLLYLLTLSLIAVAGAPPAKTKEAPSAQDAQTEVTAEERDKALKKCFSYLDERLWKLTENGSSRKFYAASMAGWAYLICAEKPATGVKLPSRSKQIARIAELLNRYTNLVSNGYNKDDKRAAKRAKKKRKLGRKKELPGLGMFGRTAQYVWNLGVAAHFFAERAARGKAKGASKKSLKEISRVLAACQQPDGGWGHDDARREGMGLPAIKIPKPGGGTLNYPSTLLAASNCALSGLGAAHAVLGGKPSKTLIKGRDYMLKSQSGDGSFPYDSSQKHDEEDMPGTSSAIAVARTSGSVLSLLLAGVKTEDEAVLKAFAAIDAHPEWLSDGHGSAAMAFGFSAVLASARGDRAWAVFRKTFFRKILNKQQEDGGCDCVCNDGFAITNDTKAIGGMNIPGWVDDGRVYVTAIHALVLALDRARLRAIPQIAAPKEVVVTK